MSKLQKRQLVDRAKTPQIITSRRAFKQKEGEALLPWVKEKRQVGESILCKGKKIRRIA